MSIKQRVPDEGKPTTRSTTFPFHEFYDFGRSADRNNFELHQIFPVVDPTLEQNEVLRLHNLPAGFEMMIDPARNVVQAFGHHPALLAQSAINCRGVLEPLDHQVMHAVYFNSSLVSANALTANSKSSRECAALTWTRTRAAPCGTTG